MTADFVVLFLQILCVIAFPTLVIKGLKGDIPTQAAFAASWLLVLLPGFAYLNNDFVCDYLEETFSGWDVPGMAAYVISSWAMTGGACAALLFSGLLVVKPSQTADRFTALFFIAVGAALIAVGELLLPIWYFGSFGWELAEINLPWTIVFGIVCVVLSAMLALSGSIKGYFFRVPALLKVQKRL